MLDISHSRSQDISLEARSERQTGLATQKYIAILLFECKWQQYCNSLSRVPTTVLQLLQYYCNYCLQ